jgi:hypothetical protein
VPDETETLVCKAVATCDNPASYLVPQKNPKGTIGWLPICWECAEGWFAGREVLGEVLEVDLADDAETKKYLGIRTETVPVWKEPVAPSAEVSS